MLNEYDLIETFQVIRMIPNTNDSGDREIPTFVKEIKGYLSHSSGTRSLKYEKETYSVNDVLFCNFDSAIAKSDKIRDIKRNKVYNITTILSYDDEDMQIYLEMDESGQDLIPGEPWVDPEDGIINGGKF